MRDTVEWNLPWDLFIPIPIVSNVDKFEHKAIPLHHGPPETRDDLSNEFIGHIQARTISVTWISVRVTE